MIRRRSLIYVPTAVVSGFSHLVSVDFNGTDEIMKNTTNQNLGIANAWTVMFWMKPTGTSFTALQVPCEFSLAADTDENIISFIHDGTSANDPFEVYIAESAGSGFKDYLYNNLIVGDVWQQIVVTWDGTTLTLYKNGSSVAPSTLLANDPGTMTNINRSVSVGANIVDTFPWVGRFHSLALWSIVLSAGEVTSIYNSGNGGGFDLSSVQGAALQHWWQLGKAGDIGFDDGVGTSIDLNANSVNITEVGDVVADAPT